MEPRLNHKRANPGAVAALSRLQEHVAQSGLDARLLMLVDIRASQINRCGY